MEAKPERHVALDVDCNCTAREGCYCQTDINESKGHPENSLNDIEDLLVMMDTKCSCQDPKIANRLNLFVSRFFTKKFQSPSWLKSMFKDRVSCAMNGVRLKTHIILPCNPNPNVQFPKTTLRKRRSRRK